MNWAIVLVALLAAFFAALRAFRVRGPVDWGWLAIAAIFVAIALPTVDAL